MKQHVYTLKVVVALHRLDSRYALLGLTCLQILYLDWRICHLDGLTHTSAESNNAASEWFRTLSECFWLEL